MKMSSLDIMVLDGESRTTLGVVRSFTRKGLSVVVGSGHPLGRSNFSRGVKAHFTYDSSDTKRAHAAILKRVERMRPRVLMPIANFGWSIVYTHYRDYAALTTVVPNPGKKYFDDLHDKWLLAGIAAQNGVSIPETVHPETRREALSLQPHLPYPVLLKPRRGVGGDNIRRVDRRHDFQRVLAGYQEMPVIQALVEGRDYELTLLCVQGDPLAGSVYISLRNAPLPYGPPSACRTIIDDELVTLGMTFLKKLGYNGVAHLDFRKDRRDNRFKLLDFSVRLAGTNDVSLCSGIDFGYMQYRLALGQTVEPAFAYAVGREYRWYLFNELRYLMKITPRAAAVRSHLKWRHVSTDISLVDPIPSFARLAEAARRLIGNGR